MQKLWLTLIATTLPLTAGAAAPGPLSVTETVEIQAPANEVWQSVKDFDNLNGWHPAVASTEITEGENNQSGAIRLLTLQDGGTIEETLEEYDDQGMSYTYVINQGVLPVSDYRSTITVEGDDSTSTVTWQGDFKRKSMSDQPPEGEDDKTAVDTMTAVYRAGLDNLKQQLEQ